MSEFFNNAKKTFIENWPVRLYNESIATLLLQLTDEETNSLIAANICTIDETGEEPTKENIDALKLLQHKISDYIKRFPNGAYVKLGSRSPKDSYIGYKEGFHCFDGEKAIVLFNDSERIREDLVMAQAFNYKPSIAVREWLTIPEWAEFRGFFKNKKLVGLSQYNYRSKKSYPEILENAGSIEWAVQKRAEQIAEFLPMPDIVADFFYKVKTYGNEKVSEVVLIELNPFDIWTDPCLFNWSKDKFETFEFRYIKESHLI